MQGSQARMRHKQTSGLLLAPRTVVPLVMLLALVLWVGYQWSSDTDAYRIHVSTLEISATIEADGTGHFWVPGSRAGGTTFSVPCVEVNGESMDDLAAFDRKSMIWTSKVTQGLQVEVSSEILSTTAVALTWTIRPSAPPQEADRNSRAEELQAGANFSVRIRDPGSSWYGGGERFHAVDQRGSRLPMASIDRPTGDEARYRSYKPVPFVMSSGGYGVWVHSYATGAFALNHAADPDHLVLSYCETRLRVVLIGGGRLLDVLAEFTRMSGRPKPPPAWTHAPWKGRDVHFNASQVIQDAELSRRHGIPASVLLIDSPWAVGYNDFEINTAQFHDPDAMFARLQQLGFYAIFWMTPFVNARNCVDMAGITEGPSGNFCEADDGGLLVKNASGQTQLVTWWKGLGGRVDFTSPRAVDFWHRSMNKTLRWAAARGFKCDDGEGQYFESDAVFSDGTPLATMRTKYQETYAEAVGTFVDKYLGGDGVLMSRSGFTGTGRSYVWAGDQRTSWDADVGLPSVIVAGQTAAASGFFLWGSDIAGYFGKSIGKELFIRWAQFGAMSPLMHQFGQANNGPWDYDRQTISIYRRFARLHMSLAPYFMEAALQASTLGRPIICPMGLCFQDDAVAVTRHMQYLLGESMLVAPIYQPGNAIEVLAGGKTLNLEVPLNEMALFVRHLSIIETIPEDTDTLVPLTPAMDASVKTLGSQRILQLWPGKGWNSFGSKSTLYASLRRSQHPRKRLHVDLNLTATSRRELEIHILFKTRVKNLVKVVDSVKDVTLKVEEGRSLERPVRIVPITIELGTTRLQWDEW
eukprot:jgi/Mesen1/3942/ME000209S02950